MSKLYFIYSAMNAGKSTMLIQTAFNYREQGMNILAFIPDVIKSSSIHSRIGLNLNSYVFQKNSDLLEIVKQYKKENVISCVLLDEAQFLTKEQVLQLCEICDLLHIPVMCYGLRTDFKGEAFEGSKYLLTLADKLVEIKTMCVCGKKAIMNLRRANNDDKNIVIPIIDGEQTDIGGNEKYISLCRKCYFEITSSLS